MTLILDSENVFDYLISKNICNLACRSDHLIESKSCKNFNLLIHLSEDKSLLIKQEPHDTEGNTNGDLLNEWRIHKLVQTYPNLNHIRSLISNAIHFDLDHSILTFIYLKEYNDLDQFYTEQRVFPESIATALGTALATIHHTTLDNQDHKTFLSTLCDGEPIEQVPHFGKELEYITPEIFSAVSMDGLTFYELYQRYDSLGQAIAQVNQQFQPCCLTHNDLKFNNILLHHHWQALVNPKPVSQNRVNQSMNNEQTDSSIIRLIDWEKWTWGDPASDLGTVIANYLKIWLKSLVVTPELDIQMSLRCAAIPLEQLQPSIATLTQAYLATVPELLQRFPNFLMRVVQFAGLALIESIQAKLHYYEPFGNTEICMLQVAKSLLCMPEANISTVFGMSAKELIQQIHSSQNLNPELKQSGKLQQPDRSQHQLNRHTSSNPNRSTSNPSIHSLRNQSLHQPTHDSVTSEDHHQLEHYQSHPYQPNSIATQDAILLEIVHHIQINSDVSIRHPQYQPPVAAEELSDRLQHLPEEIRRKYLRRLLRNYLYDIYYSGEQEIFDSATANDGQNPGFDSSQTLRNDTVRGINQDFYAQLNRNNSGTGYFDSGWQVVRTKRRETLTVTKDGLTLQITPHRHLSDMNQSLQVGDNVAIRLPNHRIESGFYMAIGNAGMVPDDHDAIEICINTTSDGAIDLMHDVTHYLNDRQIPFTFKVLINPDAYKRRDSAILQIERHQYATIRPMLQTLYANRKSQLHDAVPLFTKAIAPGVGVAEEPDTEPFEFGVNRCQLVTDGLLAAWVNGEESPEQRMDAIRQQFALHGIDLQRPYLNPNSNDIYTPL